MPCHFHGPHILHSLKLFALHFDPTTHACHRCLAAIVESEDWKEHYIHVLHEAYHRCFTVRPLITYSLLSSKSSSKQLPFGIGICVVPKKIFMARYLPTLYWCVPKCFFTIHLILTKASLVVVDISTLRLLYEFPNSVSKLHGYKSMKFLQIRFGSILL